MDFLTLAKERYSCRKFSGKAVEQEKLEKIMEAGIAAPTAVNKQPYKIWLMQSEKARKAIYEVTRFTFEADIFFVVGYLEEEAWVRKYDGRNFADVDASIVATQMMLEIQDLGLGTTWVGHFDAPRLKNLYPEMEPYGLIAIFPVGYPAEDAEPAAYHGIRKDKAEAVKIL